MASVARPAILIINNTSLSTTQELAENILQHTKNSVEKQRIHDGDVLSYHWRIDNKYYSADVEILVCRHPEIPTDVDRVEAVVIQTDAQESSFEMMIQKVKDLMEKCNPDVRLVAFHGETSLDGEAGDRLQDWCVENNFELVNMLKDGTSSVDEVDAINRVVDALQAHEWSNLQRKGASPSSSSYTLESDDDKINSFEDIFSNISEMKEKASMLSFEERKVYAEKMVIGFWNAMGLDTEEIGKLDSSEENSPDDD